MSADKDWRNSTFKRPMEFWSKAMVKTKVVKGGVINLNKGMLEMYTP